MKWATAGGKEIELVVVPNTSLYQFRFIGGGELPSDLQGMYTSSTVAEKYVTLYLDRKSKKVA